MRRLLLSVAAAAVLATGTGAASAAAVTPQDAATTDLFGQTTSAVTLSATANQYVVVLSTTLPGDSGTWVLTSTAVAVNFGAPDFVRCQIQTNGVTVALSTASVGNPKTPGGLDAGSEVIPITETGFVVTGANPVTVNVLCGHDNGWDQPYLDPSATLWLHNSPSLATS